LGIAVFFVDMEARVLDVFTEISLEGFDFLTFWRSLVAASAFLFKD